MDDPTKSQQPQQQQPGQQQWPSYDDLMEGEAFSNAYIRSSPRQQQHLLEDMHNLPANAAAGPPTQVSPPTNPSPSLSTTKSQTSTLPGQAHISNGKDVAKDTAIEADQVDAETEGIMEDEAAIRFLCDVDCGMTLLLDRVKEDLASCKEAAVFFRKRAAIEDEYAKAMSKLTRSTQDSYIDCGGKAGSYNSSWTNLLRVHDQVSENRQKFSGNLLEMSEELTTLGKEIERNRKQLKDSGQRYERSFIDAELGLEKARSRYESHSEEWERVLQLQRGEEPSIPNNKRTLGKSMGTLFKQPKTPGQLLKLEEDTRARAYSSNDQYKSQLRQTNQTRQEFFHVQMPKTVRSLKESVDEIDLGLLYHLERYAFLFENVLLNDGIAISPLTPEDGPGLRAVVEQIHSRDDFKMFMMGHSANAKSFYKADHQFEEYGLVRDPVPREPERQFRLFGVDLAEQMARDDQEVPLILEKCAAVIEDHGIEVQGIYRLSGTTSHVQKLKVVLDTSIETIDLTDPEILTDVNDIAGVLKLWLRELPDPLMTRALYPDFIEAAKLDNDKLRAITLHEKVNLLPDPNYATLKLLLCHLHRIQSNEEVNRMNVSNLAIVFGPTLMGIGAGGTDGSSLSDMGWACKVIETILANYKAIFEQPEAPEEY